MDKNSNLKPGTGVEDMKILLVQLKRAGDVLVATPAIEALSARFPKAQIDFLTEKPFAALLKNHPGLRHIQIYEKNGLWRTARSLWKKNYDLYIDFQGSPRSALMGLLSGARQRAGYAVRFWGMTYSLTVPRPSGAQSVVEGKFTLLEKLFGVFPERPPRRLYLSDAEKTWALQNSPATASKIIGLVPTHRHETRKWIGQSFVETAQQMQAAGHGVWFFWGPGEESEVAALASQVPGAWMIPKTTFREMAALLARCAVVITNDNGPMHLAVSVGTPTVTLYGPTDPRNWNPGGPLHRALQARDVPCLGCNLNHCPIQHECMTHLRASDVVAACRDLLAVTR